MMNTAFHYVSPCVHPAIHLGSCLKNIFVKKVSNAVCFFNDLWKGVPANVITFQIKTAELALETFQYHPIIGSISLSFFLLGEI